MKYLGIGRAISQELSQVSCFACKQFSQSIWDTLRRRIVSLVGKVTEISEVWKSLWIIKRHQSALGFVLKRGGLPRSVSILRFTVVAEFGTDHEEFIIALRKYPCIHHEHRSPKWQGIPISLTIWVSLHIPNLLSFFLPNTMGLGKISAQPHTIVKQICFLNGNVLFLLLFSLSKNWMYNIVWGCAEILPKTVLYIICWRVYAMPTEKYWYSIPIPPPPHPPPVYTLSSIKSRTVSYYEPYCKIKNSNWNCIHNSQF